MDKISLRKWIKNFKEGKYESSDVVVQCEAGWYDWFCKDSSLLNKTNTLGKKILQIAESLKINLDMTYIFFKNNCPLNGSLYDDFRICDLKTNEVIYTIIPSNGHTINKGRAELWGKENNFSSPLIAGTWKDIKNYFLN